MEVAEAVNTPILLQMDLDTPHDEKTNVTQTEVGILEMDPHVWMSVRRIDSTHDGPWVLKRLDLEMVVDTQEHQEDL